MNLLSVSMSFRHNLWQVLNILWADLFDYNAPDLYLRMNLVTGNSECFSWVSSLYQECRAFKQATTFSFQSFKYMPDIIIFQSHPLLYNLLSAIGMWELFLQGKDDQPVKLSIHLTLELKFIYMALLCLDSTLSFVVSKHE